MLTLKDVEEAMFGSGHPGYCTTCKEITHDRCEPDARKYECPVCKNKTVYGVEECLMMGLVTEEEDDAKA